MNYTHSDALVTTDWLKDRINVTGVTIVDASFFVPGGTAPAKEKYVKEHIPGAVFFDINDIADPDADQDHTIPSAQVFGAKVGALGINNDTMIIAYDTMGGGCAAARVWWMFKAFGHNRIAVLDGGLDRWKANGGRLTNDKTKPRIESYIALQEARDWVMEKTDIALNIDLRRFQLVDARSTGRFEGIEPEPRPGLKSGHIPGSRNLPFSKLFDSTQKTFKPADKLKAEFQAAGINLEKPITTTCGSGVTACTVALAAYLVGKKHVSIYDGSWVDWGSDPLTLVNTGPAEQL